MNTTSQLFIGLAIAATAAQASAQVTFFEHDNFRGRSFTTDHPVGDFSRFGFNDRASSVIVRSGRWELCTDGRFGGRWRERGRATLRVPRSGWSRRGEHTRGGNRARPDRGGRGGRAGRSGLTARAARCGGGARVVLVLKLGL